MSFIKDFWLSITSTILMTGIAFFNNVIITRHLGPDGRGKYSVIIYMVLLLTLFLGEGIRRRNTIILGKNNRTISTIFIQSLILIIPVVILLSILYYSSFLLDYFLPNVSNKLLLLAFSSAIFIILWQSIQAVYLGIQNIFFFNLLQIVSVFTAFLLNVIGIYLLNFGLTEIVLNFLFSAIITFLLAAWLFRDNMKLSMNFKLSAIKDSTPILFKSTASVFVLYLLLRSDIFIINYFLGSVAAGLYSIAILFSELFQKIPNTLGPLVISRTVNDDSTKNIFDVVRLVRFTFFINLILILILSIWGKELIILLFKSEFAYAFEALKYLFPALIFLGPGGIIYSYFIGRAFPLKPIIISGIIAAFSILLNLHFVPKYGIIASAAISSIVYILWSLSLLIYFKTKHKVKLSDLIFIKKNDAVYILSYFKLIFKKSNN